MLLLRRRFLWALLLCCALAAAPQARAQDAQALLEQFNNAYAAAVAADEAGDLQAALPQWQKAFEAIDYFEESEEIVPFKETVLFKLGETHRLLGRGAEDPEVREKHYAEADRIFTEILDRAVLAVYERDDILIQQGYLCSDRGKRLADLGQFKDALEQQQKAVAAFTAMTDAKRRDDALARERSAMAKTFKNLGQYQEALVALEQAVTHWQDTGNAEELRREQNAVATVKLSQGRIAEAAADLEALLAASPEAQDLTQASVAFNLGICLQLLGEYKRSQQQLDTAAKLAASLDDPGLRQQIVNSQGIVDYYLGLFQEALNNFTLAADSDDSQLRAKALLNAVAVQIASLQEQFDYPVFQQAELDATESMAIAQTMDDPRTSLAAMQNMGRLQFELASAPDDVEGPDGKLGKELRAEAYAKALDHLGRALQEAEKLRAQSAGVYEYSDIASNVGDVLLRLAGSSLEGQVDTAALCPAASLVQCAASQYRLALDNAAKIQAMEQLWQAHLGLGRASREQGNLEEAQKQLLAAIEIIESMRSVLGGAQAAGFLRNRGEPYLDYIDLMLQQWSQAPPDSPEAGKYALQALEFLERSRLSALKGLFEQALPAARQEQGRQLAGLEYRLARLRLDPEGNAKDIQSLEQETAAIEQTLQEGDRFLQKPSLDLEAVQAAMPADLAVLAWYYNDADVFVWKIEKDATSLHKTSRKIGAGRRARDLMDDFVTLFGERIAGGDPSTLLADFYAKLFKDTKLGLDPKRHPRLAMVPYGMLAGLPFGAFVTDKDSGAFLLQDFQVQYLYAVGQLLLTPKQQQASLLAVGNPQLPGYFGREVPLVEPEQVAEEKRGRQTREARREKLRAVPDLSVLPYEEAAFIYRMLNPEDYAPTVQTAQANRAFGFNPLPDAGEEVTVIGNDYEQRGLGPKASLADGSVTETALLEQMTSEPRQYVHLATHGKLLPASPLDSFLVFSEDPEAPAGYQSGLFTVRQIREELFGKLAGARLCTLSCCETALRGQGLGLELASLAAAFQSAGAAMVVASLWEVPSKATSLLMQRFYSHLFDGMMVPEALRQAQLELAGNEEYAGPFYWAAFIPIGMDPHAPQGAGAGTGQAAQ